MITVDSILLEWSYRCKDGVVDLNDPEKKAILEQVLSELGIDLSEAENEDLISLISNSDLFSDFGNLETSGKGTIKLIFSNIPNRGSQSDALRNDAYDALKQLVDQNKDLSNFKKLAPGTGSSLGSAVVNYKGKDYKLIVKGVSDESSSDTDVKEALVSLFYVTDITTPFNKENYESRLNQLIETAQKGIPGESSNASQKVVSYLTAISTDNKPSNIIFINQPLSSALAIKSAYPDQKLIRTGLFDIIRNKATSLTGLPADKWCPGDVYVQLGSVGDISKIDNIELLNDLFNDEWGETEKPLVAVSLKQAEAQGGKAKALLNKYTKAKEDYNLTSDEINFDEEQFKNGIKDLRNKIKSKISGNQNIKYITDSDDLKNDIRFLRGKYAALKSVEFLFRQFNDNEVDDAIVALAGFALSLSGVNPTFFKVTGQKSGEPGKVDTFPRGQNIILYNIDGNYEPIKIEDSSTFGGLKINFKIEKGGNPYLVSINARNNGNTQGTLEIQKIQPLSK
jgi:hypothetical protein